MKDHHYFVTTAADWDIDEDLYKVLAKNRKRQGKRKPLDVPYAVYYVPVPISEDYRIHSYRPDVDGVRLIAEGVYE